MHMRSSACSFAVGSPAEEPSQPLDRMPTLPNLPLRSEVCRHIGGEHRFTIMKGATPAFMPDCDVVVIRGLVREEA